MENEKISVIIPVYNVETYLRKCLDSVTGQTYTNLEIILIDDGSTDRSGDICDEYATKDGRILVIHKENGGVSSARNAGLAVATGKLVGFVDADDWVEPDMFEYLLGLLTKHDAGIAQCGIIIEDGVGRRTEFASQEEKYFANSRQLLRNIDQDELPNHDCNKLYRRELLEGISFDASFTIGEDLLFNLDVLRKNKSVVLGGEAKYHYLQRESSACNKVPDEGALVSQRLVLAEAAGRYAGEKWAHRYLRCKNFRNDMDICSKIVRFYRPEFEVVKKEVQKELREGLAEIMAADGFTAKERIKAALIAWCWPAYSAMVRLSARRRGEL